MSPEWVASVVETTPVNSADPNGIVDFQEAPSSYSQNYFLRVAAAFLAEREREAAERLAAAVRA